MVPYFVGKSEKKAREMMGIDDHTACEAEKKSVLDHSHLGKISSKLSAVFRGFHRISRDHEND